jgi:ferredoxin
MPAAEGGTVFSAVDGTLVVVKVTLDRDKCQGHGRCAAICPEFFELDDLG